MWIFGFFMGRGEEQIIQDIRYVKGDTIRDSVPKYILVPAKSSKPDKPKLPMRRDTFYLPGQNVPHYVTEKVDTGAIIDEFITKNEYNTTLFDNQTNGKMVVNSTVQYNKLSGMDYTFTPIHKETTIIKKKTFTPFVTGSYNTFGQVGAGGGIYYHNLGGSVKYLHDLKSKTGYEFGLHIKF